MRTQLSPVCGDNCVRSAPLLLADAAVRGYDDVDAVEPGGGLGAVAPQVPAARLAAVEGAGADRSRQRVGIRDQPRQVVWVSHRPGVAPDGVPRLLAGRGEPPLGRLRAGGLTLLLQRRHCPSL